MNISLDDWQQEVIKTKGNICLRSGRQSGKSFVISIKASKYAVENKNKLILVIASVERQAQLLFEKILAYLYDNHKTLIKKGSDRPTKHKIVLINGSTIYCLPTGMSGYGIRGYTVNLLIADEAAFIPDEVWTAVTPMLATTKGDIWLLSTPFGKRGYFYRSFEDDSFTKFHVSSEDCPRRNDEFLRKEKERMSKIQYAQEYLGEFVEGALQFFPTDLIKSCMKIKEKFIPSQNSKKYMGIDVGGIIDDNVIAEGFKEKDKMKLFNYHINLDVKTTDITRLVLREDLIYNFKKIYIDDGGKGVGVSDPLLEHPQTKRKTVTINNASRSIDYNKNRKKKILKEDLYENLKSLMEHGKIELIESPEIFQSLACIQEEYTSNERKLYGNYSHIAEALIRLAWAAKDKTLNIYIY